MVTEENMDLCDLVFLWCHLKKVDPDTAWLLEGELLKRCRPEPRQRDVEPGVVRWEMRIFEQSIGSERL